MSKPSALRLMPLLLLAAAADRPPSRARSVEVPLNSKTPRRTKLQEQRRKERRAKRAARRKQR